MGNNCHTAKIENDENYIEFDKHIYSKGSVRYAYHGEQTNKQMIVKTFKNRASNTMQNWECDIQASRKAASLAQDFINELNNISTSQCCQMELRFVIPFSARVINAACVITSPNKCVRKDQYVLVEPLLIGSYIKYSDNQGFENKSYNERGKILFAFSHWTYENSQHTLLVSDLQGIDNEYYFMLTDPAIHSKDQIFGLTDLSFAGMKKVMNGHSCNEICRHLNLTLYENARTHKPESRTIMSNKLSIREKQRNKELQNQSIVSARQIEIR